jgi:DNA helicase IV
LREDENNSINITANKIQEIINYSRNQNKKSIIFINGVPGSGKTLVGLDVVARNSNFANNE